MNGSTFLSLFSGIGGLDLGLERAGWRCVGQVEIDGFCQRVLGVRWPNVPKWGDVHLVLRPDESQGGQDVPPDRDRSPVDCDLYRAAAGIDLLVGGWPCQDISVAGRRAGLAGERSGLFWEIVRIAKILRPAWGLFENVPGLFSSNAGRDFALVLDWLRECWPAVGYRILDSQYVGGCPLHGRSAVPQRRRRVFFVCGPDEACVASVLFEPESGSGNPAASRAAGTDATAGTGSGAEDAGVLCEAVTAKWAKGGGPSGDEAANLVVSALDGAAGGVDDNDAQGWKLVIGDVSHALSATHRICEDGGGGRGVPLIWALQEVDARKSKNQNGIGIGIGQSDVMYTQHGIGTPQIVRRLTPTEAERLQGFPDGWTCLCQSLDAWANDAEAAAERCRCPDSPRYRALGNAVTVSVAEWLGRRLKAVAVIGR